MTSDDEHFTNHHGGAGGKKNKRGKKKKDPNAPKRAQTAWIIYSTENRPRLKAENPDLSFGDCAKILSDEFKQLPEKDRAKYEKLAEDDKLRYQREMESYVPPPDDVEEEEDEDSNNFDESDEEEKPAKKGKKKQKKDPNAPKRAMTSYLFFSAANREKIKAENPGVTFGQIGKLLGAQYKALSDDEKAKYVKLATADKDRYKKELEAYNSNEVH